MAKVKTDFVNHLNSIDSQGNIYCRFLEKVTKIDLSYKLCGSCPYAYGIQENGIECFWEDIVTYGNTSRISDPYREAARVTKLINKGVIKAHNES